MKELNKSWIKKKRLFLTFWALRLALGIKKDLIEYEILILYISILGVITGRSVVLFFYCVTRWRCWIISEKIRINEKIKGREFRIISSTGEQLGVMSANEALELARQEDLDLVEISPTAKPPVCKIMDFGKYRYEQTRKAKEAKKNQKQVVIKEVKVTARIDTHDLETKMGQIEKFLSKENKVKVTLVLFGRERMHATLGIDTLNEIAEKFAEVADADKKYNEKQKHIILTPKKS